MQLARKFPILAFVLVLLVSVCIPSVELGFHNGVDNTRSAAVSTGARTSNTGDDSLVLGGGEPLYTPVPTPLVTPTPTPKPTPTPEPTPEPTPMARGMSGPEIKALQGQLLTLGFLPDEPDGIYGKGTEDAIKLLQTYLNECERDMKKGEQPQESMGGAQPLFIEGTALAESEPAPTPVPSPDPYPVTGVVNGKLMQTLRDGNFPVYRETGLMLNSQGTEVRRLQSRLNSLKYVWKNVDGVFGANTEEGLRYFQQLHGLAESGIADQDTLNMLYSPMAKENDKPLHPYYLIVDVSDQRVYVYAYHDGKYDKRVKTFKCSTGLSSSPTPLGTYQDGTGPGNRWHYFKKFNCWAQYAYYIEGDVLFHSVLYSKRDTRTLSTGSLYNLGSRASHGCVRLQVKDAKWIWTNCSAGTTVKVRK